MRVQAWLVRGICSTSLEMLKKQIAEMHVSRPGSLIAGAWAAMHYMGEEYVAFNICYSGMFPNIYPKLVQKFSVATSNRASLLSVPHGLSNMLFAHLFRNCTFLANQIGRAHV